MVTCTITVESKRGGAIAKVLLCERNTSPYGHLGTDDTITTEERGSEDMHRATLAMGHASLAAKKLSNNALDGTTTHDSEGVTPVRGNDPVFRLNTILKTNGDSFLIAKLAKFHHPIGNTKYLANS